MNKEERKKKISKIIYLKGHVRIKDLSDFLCVSERTIERDIIELSNENFPLYTQTGRYNGGIYLMKREICGTLFAKELDLLKKIEKAIEEKRVIILTSEEESYLKMMIHMIAYT